jgi:hypothetical protein
VEAAVRVRVLTAIGGTNGSGSIIDRLALMDVRPDVTPRRSSRGDWNRWLSAVNPNLGPPGAGNSGLLR